MRRHHLGSKVFASPLAFIILALFMTTVGVGSLYAALNTYEVITEKNLPYITTITGTHLTDKAASEQSIVADFDAKFSPGSFGMPEKIRLPESPRHITLKPAVRQDGLWNINKNTGHVFITDSPRQKMFGEAVIYMRTDSITLRNLGAVLVGDSFNIVTNEKWQLGFTVYAHTSEYSESQVKRKKKMPSIVLIMINDTTYNYYYAELSKVGERL